MDEYNPKDEYDIIINNIENGDSDSLEDHYRSLDDLYFKLSFYKKDNKYPPLIAEYMSKIVFCKYRRIETNGELINLDDAKIPPKTTSKIKKFLADKTNKFSLHDLQLLVIPVCIEYKVDHKQYWKRIQGWE